MNKKSTFGKVTLAVGIMAMSVGMLNSFDAEARQGGGCVAIDYEPRLEPCGPIVAGQKWVIKCRPAVGMTCDVSSQIPCSE